MPAPLVRTFAPTVLLVDDDPAVLDIFGRRFHEHTSLGIMKMKNLGDAYNFLMQEQHTMDALLADISFVPETQDDEHQLYDGLDLIGLSQKRFPDMPRYVCSVYGQDKIYLDRAKELNLVIVNWFPKLAMDQSVEDSPWNRIERDIYYNTLKANANLLEQAEQAGINSASLDNNAVLDWIRTSIRPCRQTYFQQFGRGQTGYRVIKPIKVICEEMEDGQVSAEAPALGLLLPGMGGNVDDALANLGELIIEQYEEFLSVGRDQLVGYAAKVFERIEEHVALPGKDGAQA